MCFNMLLVRAGISRFISGFREVRVIHQDQDTKGLGGRAAWRMVEVVDGFYLSFRL